MDNINKAEAISIISKAAKIYKRDFCDRNLLIVFGAPANPNFIIAKASSSNFLHLTGLKLNNNIKDNTPDRFLAKVLAKKLEEKDFDFKDRTTEYKLSVLIQTLTLPQNAKMFGDYNWGHINLKTDKLAGSVSSFLGFIKQGDVYYPNTVIAGDIRDDSMDKKTHKVLAIISKHIKDKEYSKVEAIGKGVDLERLLAKIADKVSIHESLLRTEFVIPNYTETTLSPLHSNEKCKEYAEKFRSEMEEVNEVFLKNPNIKFRFYREKKALFQQYLPDHKKKNIDNDLNRDLIRYIPYLQIPDVLKQDKEPTGNDYRKIAEYWLKIRNINNYIISSCPILNKKIKETKEEIIKAKKTLTAEQQQSKPKKPKR